MKAAVDCLKTLAQYTRPWRPTGSNRDHTSRNRRGRETRCAGRSSRPKPYRSQIAKRATLDQCFVDVRGLVVKANCAAAGHNLRGVWRRLLGGRIAILAHQTANMSAFGSRADVSCQGLPGPFIARTRQLSGECRLNRQRDWDHDWKYMPARPGSRTQGS